MNKNTTERPKLSAQEAAVQETDANGAAREAVGAYRSNGQGLNGSVDGPVAGEGLYGSNRRNPFDPSQNGQGFAPETWRPPSSQMSEDDDDALDWRGMLAMLRRRRKTMTLIFLSIVGLGMLLTFLTRPMYRASSSLLLTLPVAGASKDSSGADLPVLTALMSNARASSQTTQIAILQGPETMNGALKRLPENGRRTLLKNYSVAADPQADTDIINVAVQSYDPQVSADFANALCAEYITQSKMQGQAQLNDAADYLNGRLRVVSTALDNKRRELKNFQVKNGSVDLQVDASARTSALSNIQESIRQNQADRMANVAQVAALQARVASLPASVVRPTGLRRSTKAESLKESLTALELQRLKLTQEYTAGSDEVRQVDAQIAGIKADLQSTAATEVTAYSTGPDPIRETARQEAARLQGIIWAQEARDRALKTSEQQSKEQLKTLPQQQYLLSQLTTDLQTLQKTYEQLNDKYLSLRLQRDASVSNATILSPAAPELKPVSPKKLTNLVLSILTGLILAIASAALAEHLDDRVHTPQEAEQATGLPILANIPFEKDKAKQTLLENGTHSSVLLESCRMLRTNIEFAAIGKPLRSITVTSTQPGEGKSTISVDLAVVMALDGRKVILMDADLRRPTLHTFFDLPNRAGFTGLVNETTTLEEALQPTSVPNLFLLSSGPIPPNPPELLNSKAARAVLSKIAEECDFLVVDTPPALVIADAQVMASATDAALLVVSMQEGGKRQIARTGQTLAHTGTHVLGVVLNKASQDAFGGSYKDYDKHYGAYLKS
jgi:succinoglycan biosynthesis transport protein ExoP